MQKKNFHGDDVIDDVTGWPQSFPLYSCLGELFEMVMASKMSRCDFENSHISAQDTL